MKTLHVAVAAFVTGTLALSLSSCVSVSGVTAEDVDVVATQTVAAADATLESGNWKEFCHLWAADEPMCLMSIKSWSNEGSAPDISTVRFTSTKLSEKTRRVVFTGSLVDGRVFTSETELLNPGDGKPRLVDPVFWVPRTVSSGPDES